MHEREKAAKNHGKRGPFDQFRSALPGRGVGGRKTNKEGTNQTPAGRRQSNPFSWFWSVKPTKRRGLREGSSTTCGRQTGGQRHTVLRGTTKTSEGQERRPGWVWDNRSDRAGKKKRPIDQVQRATPKLSDMKATKQDPGVDGGLLDWKKERGKGGVMAIGLNVIG